ncbi:MAG: DUF374 domain-containing protein [Acidobacteriia bacterium]|nr:DUF374 domain-containing protein [Terriglobia bacterium]
MQPEHLPQLYSDSKPEGDAARRIRELAQIADQLRYTQMSEAVGGRRRLTRRIDALIGWVREHAPVLHKAGAALFALLLFVYCRWVGLTARLVTAGAGAWPDLPASSVLALWHGASPAFLCAVARRRPRVPMAIMVSPDPRGDSLAILCRLMRLRVIRGDRSHGGWEALARMSTELERGACAILTPDGGGPAKFAKPGAVVLAAASGAPLFALGADCAPALTEPNKWDAPRNPLPFGRIAIAISEPIHISAIQDGATLDSGRSRLQQALDQSAVMASEALNVRFSTSLPR